MHADLKPANFVLVNSLLKLIDFGIAAQIVADETTVYRKGVQGTLNYISPEAISCRPNGDGYEVSRFEFKCLFTFLDSTQIGCLVTWMYSLRISLRRTAICSH